MKTIDGDALLITTKDDITKIVRDAVSEALLSISASRTRPLHLVSGLGNIAEALAVSQRKLVTMIQDGTLQKSIRKNGKVYICDINEAFNELDRMR